MTSLEIKHIESILQYEFKNKKLLEEAFLVLPEADDLAFSSEIFRIPGKRAINFALTHIVLNKYGKIEDEGYRATSNKNEVNFIIDNLYTREVYARNIQILGLADYLNVPDEEHYDDMTRRLFESLVGAVTIDSNWDLSVITPFVSYLLDSDFYLENGFESFDKHYILKIYNWCVENGKTYPAYRFSFENGVYKCTVKFGASMIIGSSKSKTLAKFDAARQVYEKLVSAGWLIERDKDGYLIGNPNITVAESMDFLKEKEEANEIGKVVYDIKESDNGLVGICVIEGVDFKAESKGNTTKEEALNNASYKMVRYLLGYRVTD